MLTENQKNNIARMCNDDLLEILEICSEQLGLITVDEYIKATGIPKRTVYHKIKSKQIIVFDISGKNFL